MMHSYKPAESSSARIFVRARQIVVAATMLIALTLAAPPRLSAQCTPITNISTSVSPKTVPIGQRTDLTITFTLNTPVVACNTNGGDQIDVIWGAFAPGGSGPLSEGDCLIPVNKQSCNYKLTTYGWGLTQPTRVAFIVGPYAPDHVEVTLGPPQPPADMGVDCKNCHRFAVAGSPINVTDGNVWIQHRDYSVPGLGGGLELSRVWNSRWMAASPPTLEGMFGSGWRSTYEEQLALVDAGTMIYWRGDGSGWTFTYNPVLNSYLLASPPDERAQLVSNVGGGFTLTLPNGTQKVFNGQNLLAAVIDRSGNQTTVAYDGSNRITSVTSAGGSTLSFTYGDSNNPMQVTSVQDSVGTVATYTYDSTSRLTSVTYADGSGYNFAFDPNSPPLILSVTDKQGKVIEAHTYDSQNFGRGLTSTRAYGVDSVSLTY